jgi:outer membrane protein assembly factor BamB
VSPALAVRALACAMLLLPASSLADDQPQWGERHTRNMVSRERGLPDAVDPATGRNVKWSVELGTQTYSTPVVARGCVFIGTNNARPRDERHRGDRGVLLCLDERDGKLRWQLASPKRSEDPYLDWTETGLVSPVVVEGDRVYLVTNRDEVACLDVQGMANGNQGPYLDESAHMALRGGPAEVVDPTDADILWLFDIPTGAGVHTHDAAHGNPLLVGRFLYVNTSNGVDSTHLKVPAPDAPSLIVLDRETGRLVAADGERIGPRIIHCTWSSPALATVGGRDLVIFCGGDGVVYAFEPLRDAPAAGSVARLKRVWRFDCDPTAPKENVHRWQDNFTEGPSTVSGMPVVHGTRVYVVAGGDPWHGKRWSWLKCIDATKTGEITKTGELWSYRIDAYCDSTVAVLDGLVYAADWSGTVHCVDAVTGKAVWTHKLSGEIWGSPLAADGKVYVGTRRGELCVFAAGRQKRVISTTRLDGPISGTPVAANGVLYVATANRLWAFAQSR